jgi:hypothetical protein
LMTTSFDESVRDAFEVEMFTLSAVCGILKA